MTWTVEQTKPVQMMCFNYSQLQNNIYRNKQVGDAWRTTAESNHPGKGWRRNNAFKQESP